VTAFGDAFDNVATRSTTALESPCNSQPNRAASSPSVAAIANDPPLPRAPLPRGGRRRRRPRGRRRPSRLEESEHRLRDVHGCAHEDHVGIREHEIELRTSRVLLGLQQHVSLELAELFVTAQVEILAKLGLGALILARRVANLPLEVRALFLTHDGGIALECLLLRTQLCLHRREVALTRTEFVLQLLRH